MELPTRSPFFSPTVGIDKAEVVRQAIQAGGRVAFAGDGPPDLAPAVLVAEDLRFARGHLAAELTRRGLGFRPFERWSAVASALAERACASE